MTFLDKAIVAFTLISMKKNSTVLCHSSFDKRKYSPDQSAIIKHTSSDCGILKGPLNF